MKKKIIVWDFIGIAKQWIALHVDEKNMEVIQIVTSSDRVVEFPDEWDYLIILGFKYALEGIVKELELPSEQVVYALYDQSWKEHPDAKRCFMSHTGPGRRAMDFLRAQQAGDYVTCTTDEGLSYVAASSDSVIMSRMYVSCRNWAKEEMELFYSLSRQYYGTDHRQGWFLDLGANIGTTGIYFQKKLDSNVRLLAFEPDSTNYRMLLVNILLNRMEGQAVAEQLGLGAKKDEMTIHKSSVNPGENSLLSDYGEAGETVRIVPLDDYFLEKRLRFADVKYIWVDVEGFELQVLYGARNLLRDHGIPVFLEYNPHLWKQAGFLDEALDVLSSIYSGYIRVPEALEGHGRIHPLAELHAIKENPFVFGTGGDIFLVK